MTKLYVYRYLSPKRCYIIFAGSRSKANEILTKACEALAFNADDFILKSTNFVNKTLAEKYEKWLSDRTVEEVENLQIKLISSVI